MPHAAVLGAGIMGTCLSLYLARKGFDVTLFDAAAAPLQGASRWNEGKIHLGYLYAADPSLQTARQLLSGGLAFAPLVEDLTGAKLEAVTQQDDLYLVHRDSVVGPGDVGAYFDAVSALVREAGEGARYLTDVSGAAARPLRRGELEAIADPRLVVAGFRVPERSVSTVAVADALTRALAAEPRIRRRMGERVSRVDPLVAADGPWRVGGETFDWVVNALWEGRVAIDVTAGLAPPPGWSHRYRVSAFVQTRRPLDVPSAVIAVGPFGDVKNYDGRAFYVSWYHAGLMSEGFAAEPPAPPRLDAAAKARIASAIADGLAQALPAVRSVFDEAERVEIEGGYVFAQGQGALSERSSTLHRRDRFGVRRMGRYMSVDTGKYSTAPLMARSIASDIASAGR